MTPRAVAISLTGFAIILGTYGAVAFKRMLGADKPDPEADRIKGKELAKDSQKTKELNNEHRSKNTKECDAGNGLEKDQSQRQILQPQAQRSSQDKPSSNHQIVSSPG